MGRAGADHRRRGRPAGGGGRCRLWRQRRLPARAGQARGWRYVLAVTGTASARLRDAVPETMAYGGLGRPSVPRYRTAPVSVRQLAIAHAGQTQPVTWRHGTRITPGNPGAAMTSQLPDDPGPPRQPAHPPALPTAASRSAGCWPNGPRSGRARRLLAV